jgi:hypothetical protein
MFRDPAKQNLWFALAVASIALLSRPAVAGHRADSTADFSTEQGTKHWHYGYIRPADGSPKFTKLVQTGQADGGWTHLQVYKFWTWINATGQHPNGTNGNGGRKEIEEWAIRRWTSPWIGTAHISGTVGGNGGGGGEIVASIAVDGVTYFTTTQYNTTQTPFAFDVSISKGSVVDMVLAPYNHYDVNNWTPFAASIEVN